MKEYEEYLNKENVIYSSDKNYRCLYFPLLLIFTIFFGICIIYLFDLKDVFFDNLPYEIIIFSLICLYIAIQETVLLGKKVIITKSEILFFNFCGKLVKQYSLADELIFICNNYCFDIRKENEKPVKVCHERDNFLIFDILKRSGNVSFAGIKDFDVTAQKAGNSVLEKIFTGIYILIILFCTCFCIYNRNEVISYYYLSKSNHWFKEEAKTQNGKFVNISVESENLKRYYEYKKLACEIYPQQEKAVYDSIIAYAYIHKLTEDYNEYVHFAELLYKE